MKITQSLILIGAVIASAIGGWMYGSKGNNSNWNLLSEQHKQELAGTIGTQYKLSDLKTTRINGLKVYGPKNEGGPKMLYIVDDNYSVSLDDRYVVVRFSDDNAISISDLDGDGYFEQLENVVKNDQGELLEMLDQNRDGTTDSLFKNGEKVSTSE